MTLPAWLRVVQQSIYFHLLQSAILAGVTAWLTCDPAKQTQSCEMVGVVAFIGALYLSFQHSPGSASFKPDGEVNQTVRDVVKVQKAAEAAPSMVNINAALHVAQTAANSAATVKQ